MGKILIADDKKNEVKNLITLLKKNYDIEYVSDGRKAWNRIQRGNLDGIVLDGSMAPEDLIGSQKEEYEGDSVAKRTRRLYLNMPIIVRSNSAFLYEDELASLDIYCCDKFDDNSILKYFQKKLNK